MKRLQLQTLMAASAALAFVAACEPNQPRIADDDAAEEAREAGDALERDARDVGDELEQGARELGDKAEAAGEEIEDGAERAIDAPREARDAPSP